MITEFGKELRKLRVDNDEILKDMATRLGVTASFISAIEHGKKNISNEFLEKLYDTYQITDEYKQILEAARVDKEMIVDSTIFSGMYSTWRIRISPDTPNDDYSKKELDQELTRPWQPSNGMKWIFFHPRISIIVMSKKADKQRVWIPTSLLYSLRDCIQTSYARLSTKGLFYERDGVIYCDKAEAQRQRIILPIPGGFSVLFEPTVFYNKEKSRIGISLHTSNHTDANGVFLAKTEAKELFTVLDHVDLNSYSAILAILEKMERLEERTDKLLEGQQQILQMVGKLLNHKELSQIDVRPTESTSVPQVNQSMDQYEPYNDDLPF